MWIAQISIVSGLGLLGGQTALAQIDSVNLEPVESFPSAEPAPAFNAPSIAVDSNPDSGLESNIPQPVFTPEPVFTPPPEGTSLVEPSNEGIEPSRLVPASIPELPEEYSSVFIDPTDYSIGATTADAPTLDAAPEIVVTERSSGCQFSVGEGRSLPDAVCGQSNQPAAVVAQESSPAAPTTRYAQAQPSRADSGQSMSIGPISISSAGVRIADNTTAQNRAYYNKATRPIVNLQQGRNFIFPLSIPSPITSLFGWRLHPISGDQRFHTGTDIGAPKGTPVLAARTGRVAVADTMGGYGLTVVLRHGEKEDLESLYPHLSQLLVEPGEQVEQGDVIGLVGSTGNSTGPHLHFEMRQLTADGWVTVNTDDLVRQTMATLVQTLNNPLLALKEQAQQTDGSSRTAIASEVLKVLSFRPAQPNAN